MVSGLTEWHTKEAFVDLDRLQLAIEFDMKLPKRSARYTAVTLGNPWARCIVDFDFNKDGIILNK